MQIPTYTHPAAAARAIPIGEEPLVTKAKVCAQLRTAIAELETGAFDPDSIARAQAQIQGAQRVLFVARVQARCPRVYVGLGREARV